MYGKPVGLVYAAISVAYRSYLCVSGRRVMMLAEAMWGPPQLPGRLSGAQAVAWVRK